ncbi:uncharacterized protein LOC131326609 isoform X2 [Rhododendron vialii]|uniref:uncharacterized protein LOC131326609 isoform X2 n=1 Tax=Rhododendron vialii TaxID=182163 RepID=UPI00265DB256|nr:uncharacterized protein LOC131326609 isoform X2 [Rhododendron vialii]
MSLKSTFICTRQNSPLTPNRNLGVLPSRAFQVRECRVWRRRRLKTNRKTVLVRSLLGPSPFGDLFQNLVSHFPSLNSLDFIAPVLGLTSGAVLTLYLSRFKSNRNSRVSDVGEWRLFSSPTRFNRFVMLRCPSMSFQGSDQLLNEERHLVKLNSGRIQVRLSAGDDLVEERERLVYQRVCVGTEDGGVISLDWPSNLELEEELGLDTTVLLIPGTAQGSMDKDIRSFVCELLTRGYFPVVVNPRGCAGSPLTTPRLFTAADSDDICTAIQFINRARPWTTLMGVGWGYGASMLTKYLAEVGDRTPLTGATCIDNPFDLEEAARSSPYHTALDQKLTDGLKDILRSNKELFRGGAKGFDVEKALLAKSVQDFEKTISMVSHGFDAIEDFYANSSTRGVIGNVKIPVLFIQWLAAVELGLLKGRHPLLKDGVTVNPSNGLPRVESRASDKRGRLNKILNASPSNVLDRYGVYPLEKVFGESDTSLIIRSKFGRESQKKCEIEDKGLQRDNNGLLEQTSFCNAELVNEEASPIDNGRGQVLQTAQVVMNMIDVSMPNSLTEEQKKKVLNAVGQGETVMKAFQDAVPEDVREKFTTAASGILRNRGANLKLDSHLNIGPIPTVPSEIQSEMNERAGVSSAGGYEDPHSSDPRTRVDDLEDYSDGQILVDKPAGGVNSERQASDTLHKMTGYGHFQSTTHGGNVSCSIKEDIIEGESNHENGCISRETDAEYYGYNENESAAGGKPYCPGWSVSASGTGNVAVVVDKVDQNGLVESDKKEGDDIQENIEIVTNLSTDPNKMMPSTEAEEGLSHPVSSFEAQPMKREGSMHSVHNQNSYDPATFSVSQALDALTGIDDSTQVAVSSVFGVLEGMITQLEFEKADETKFDKKEVEDGRAGFLSKNRQLVNDYNSMSNEENNNDLSSQSDMENDLPSYDEIDLHNDARSRWEEEGRPISSPDSVLGNSISSSWENSVVCHINEEKGTGEDLLRSKLLAKQPNKVRHLFNSPLYITTNPFSDTLYKEYLPESLLSKTQSKSLDSDTTTTLFLDYIPEEGQWKLLEQPGNNEHVAGDVNEGDRKDIRAHSPSKAATIEVIKPLYVIMDAGQQQEPVQEYGTVDYTYQKCVINNCTSEELMSFVKSTILDALKVEVGRRLSVAKTKEMEPNLAKDLEEIANAVSLAAGHILSWDVKNHNSEKLGTLNGEHIVKAISLAVQETNYVRRLLPLGIVVGLSLAALRKSFNVATVNGSAQSETITLDQISQSAETNCILSETDGDLMFLHEVDLKYNMSRSKDWGKAELGKLNNAKIMVGAVTAAIGASAVTAAIGASALLVHQQDSDEGNETSTVLSKTFGNKGNHQKEPGKLEEDISEKSENGIVTSFADKAMSVAGTMVPMKANGEVDHKRLVAMLAELGQRGGMLKLVGKIALLWGGVRGAISLTGRLILFLNIAERPLLQRVLGFVCMVLILWSPFAVPLLPALVKSWVTHSSSKFAELVCIAGLYASITMLIAIWGRRIRGYDNPFEQYGLDFSSSSKIQNVLKGFVGGVMLVLSIHTVNLLLGCVRLSWPSTVLSYPSDVVNWLKVFAKMLLLVSQGIITATGVALVEELLFRSWLPDEIATDLGYYRGIIFSGLAFSVSQRSPWAIPSLWLLSMALAGAQERSQGSLSIPVGLRSGIMASGFVLQKSGILTYQANYPMWVTSTDPLQPFSGLVGLAFGLLVAIILHPRQPLHQQKNSWPAPE